MMGLGRPVQKDMVLLFIAYGMMLSACPVTSPALFLCVKAYGGTLTGTLAFSLIIACFFVTSLYLISLSTRKIGFLQRLESPVALIVSTAFIVVCVILVPIMYFEGYASGMAFVVDSLLIGAGEAHWALVACHLSLSHLETARDFRPYASYPFLVVSVVVACQWALLDFVSFEASIFFLASVPVLSCALLLYSLKTSDPQTLDAAGGGRGKAVLKVSLPKPTKFIIGSLGAELAGIWMVLFQLCKAEYTVLWPASILLAALGGIGLGIVRKEESSPLWYTNMLRAVLTVTVVSVVLACGCYSLAPWTMSFLLMLAFALQCYPQLALSGHFVNYYPVNPFDAIANLARPYAIGFIAGVVACLLLMLAIPDGTAASMLVAAFVAGAGVVAALLVPTGEEEMGSFFVERLTPEQIRVRKLDARCEAVAQAHSLTPRELEVLRMLAAGDTQESIARQLFVSTETVKTHARHIYTKLDVHSRRELMALVVLDDAS